MKVNEILQEGKVKHIGSFIKYLFNLPQAKKEYDWYDLEDVEDLFDSAYADDCLPENIGLHFAEEKTKNVTLATAEKEALSRVKFMIDNMEDKKQWEKIVTPVAVEWAKKVAPEILHWISYYSEAEAEDEDKMSQSPNAIFKDVKVGSFFYVGTGGRHYKKDSETTALYWPGDHAPHPREKILPSEKVRVANSGLKKSKKK